MTTSERYLPARSALLAILPALLALADCSSTSAQTRRARQLLAAGDYAGAEREADAELAVAPQRTAAWRVKVQAAMGRRDAASAVKAYAQLRAQLGEHDPKSLRAMALATLWQGLHAPSAELKVQAIEIAERLELEPLAEPVAERMGDDDDRVAAAAAVAVLRSHPDAPQVATRSLHSADARARAIAVAGIGRKVGRAARADLATALSDSDASVRRAAIAALTSGADADDAAAFARLAGSDDDGGVRAAALRALGAAAAPAGLDLARRAVDDPYLGARLAAVEVIERLGDRLGPGRQATTDELIVLTRHRDPFVALRASVATASRGDAGSRVLIAASEALQAKQWPIRAAAVNALSAGAGAKPARQFLLAASRDPSIDVRLAAARALLHFGAIDLARPILSAALTDQDQPARIEAGVDLARIGDPSGVETLAALAADGTPELRLAAVRAHAQVKSISDSLVAALADESALVRLAAASALLERPD